MKIINTKVNSNLCQTAEMELFHESLLASEANSEFFYTSRMELFAKIDKNEKPFTNFAKSLSLMFDKVRNVLLNWLKDGLS